MGKITAVASSVIVLPGAKATASCSSFGNFQDRSFLQASGSTLERATLQQIAAKIPWGHYVRLLV
jgi:hypothetical protein